MAGNAGENMDSDWVICLVADGDAFRGVENCAEACSAMVGGVEAQHEAKGCFVAVIARF